MADVKWTKGQQNCIEARGGTVLVSAAAGSGKTAVLVQRVINRITDPDCPTDIDRLLIVTFTHAAASEMKQRLSKVLAEKLAADPHNAHLRRQQRLLPGAHISTVHAFCSKLLKEYYYLLDIAPQVKLVDTPTEKLLKADAMTEMLEDKYRENDPAFIRLANAIGASKNDSDLIRVIGQIHEFIQSYPFPDAWLNEREASYDDTVPFAKIVFGKRLIKNARERVRYAARLYETALAMMSANADLDAYYRTTFFKEQQALNGVFEGLKTQSWTKALGLIESVSFGRLPALKGCSDPDLQNQVKALRDQAKKMVKKVQDIFSIPEQQARDDLRYHAEIARVLFDLVREFERRYADKKAARRLLDFADLEHLALKLLVTQDADGNACPTPLAREMSARFDEILVDEYQDTNAVQDTLFVAISKDEQNLFMVGDVKQSVYGFRKAMPELFLKRRKQYPTFDGTRYPASIALRHNFRSRHEVTGIVNFIFRQWMTDDLCGMDYDKREELAARATYTPMDDRAAELMIVRSGDGDSDAGEAQAIADRIRDMKDTFLVEDKGVLRPMTYRDVVILLRSTKGHAQTFVETLRQNGIPAYTDEAAGFFETPEIARIMALLRVIDNPVQDVPLLSVMLSPLFGFLPDDLAAIRSIERYSPLYVTIRKAMRSNRIAPELAARLGAFIDRLEHFRNEAVSMSADRLVQLVMEETQYPALVRAGTRGAAKTANLRQLCRYAKQFEQNGFRGLSAFIRFCDRLEQQGLDMNAAIGGDAEDAVHIMTVHHSKGLEFPVVFVARLGANFNTDSEKSELLLHNHIGLGMERRDTDTLRRYDTLPHLCVKQAIRENDRAEEARVLYVALTRAKEKLILVMSSKKPEDDINAAQIAAVGDEPISAFYLQNASSFGQWVLAALVRHPQMRGGLPCDETLTWRIITPGEQGIVDESADDAPVIRPDAALTQQMRDYMAYHYPFEAACTIPTKLAASHLPGEPIMAGKSTGKRPAFSEGGRLSPAERGIAVHTFMQYASLDAIGTCFEEELARLITAGHLTNEQAAVVDKAAILRFAKSDLCDRIKNAKTVLREWRFNIAIPASELFEQAGDIDDTVTMQGMVDCAIIEDDHVMLVDYKTDRVKNRDELIERYRRQLAIYAKAIEQIRHLPVTEIYLYSFTLGEAVPIPTE